jgi:hypothetical protein
VTYVMEMELSAYVLYLLTALNRLADNHA